MTYPVWSKIDTHCVVCLQPFPTHEDIERHAAQDCIEPVCWCESLCWANEGGDCDGDPTIEDFDDLGLWRRLRAVEEAAGVGGGAA